MTLGGFPEQATQAAFFGLELQISRSPFDREPKGTKEVQSPAMLAEGSWFVEGGQCEFGGLSNFGEHVEGKYVVETSLPFVIEL